jgi:hypothetical protein
MKKKFKQIFDEAYLKGGEWYVNAKKNGYKIKEKRVFKFTWEYCPTCRTMSVRCPKCGNNCCNTGFGDVTPDGKPIASYKEPHKTCDVCNLAYAYQDLAYKAKLVP